MRFPITCNFVKIITKMLRFQKKITSFFVCIFKLPLFLKLTFSYHVNPLWCLIDKLLSSIIVLIHLAEDLTNLNLWDGVQFEDVVQNPKLIQDPGLSQNLYLTLRRIKNSKKIITLQPKLAFDIFY